MIAMWGRQWTRRSGQRSRKKASAMVIRRFVPLLLLLLFRWRGAGDIRMHFYPCLDIIIDIHLFILAVPVQGLLGLRSHRSCLGRWETMNRGIILLPCVHVASKNVHLGLLPDCTSPAFLFVVRGLILYRVVIVSDAFLISLVCQMVFQTYSFPWETCRLRYGCTNTETAGNQLKYVGALERECTYRGGRRIYSCSSFSVSFWNSGTYFWDGLTHDETSSWAKDIERSIWACRASVSIPSSITCARVRMRWQYCELLFNESVMVQCRPRQFLPGRQTRARLGGQAVFTA